MEILADHLLSFVDDIIGVGDKNIIRIRISNDFIFMQDDASCHKNEEMIEFLVTEDLEVMH